MIREHRRFPLKAMGSSRWRGPGMALGFIMAALAGPPAAIGQQTGEIVGRITVHETGEPVAAAVVEVRPGGARAATNAGGRFHLARVHGGAVVLRVTAIGHRPLEAPVSVEPGGTVTVTLALDVNPIQVSGIEVSVLRPDLRRQTRLEQEAVREANPRDPGELLRQVSGVDAVRRGPLGLDPSVQGLRETEVGSFVDGERRFPAGPARMDSPLTHVDPLAFRSVEVVKGPYALTWGAGNLSAIRVETQSLPPDQPGALHGNFTAGYDTNVRGIETSGGLLGRSGAVSYWGFGAYREGSDYEDGNGEAVPGDYRSWEARGKVGYDVASGSSVVLAGGYQDQGPVDYPGRILNAESFETWNASGRWLWRRAKGGLRGLDVSAYFNDTDHAMSNREKPTAAMLDIGIASSTKVSGGRAAAILETREWEVEVGGDVYSANRQAVRTIRTRETGMVMLQDLLWPDATTTAGGLFARTDRSFSGALNLSGTVRLDFVESRADTVSEWFAQNVGTNLRQTETNLSGAVTVGVHLGSNWNVWLGGGSAVRTADASERYSDRFPASKSQVAAEFVGDPALRPERSTQGDIGVEGSFSGLLLQGNVFARRIDEYITLQPTEYEKKLPLSPDTVYRYVNGDATFWGVEASATLALAQGWSARLRTDYLWGEDDSLGEPALGVTPWRGTIGLRYEEPRGRFYGEGTVSLADAQNRVAASRGETPTPGYMTGDLRFGWRVTDGLLVRFGIQNVGDVFYVNHLNAKNPFTGEQIPEPGRIFYANLGFAF